jgi:MFS family permease
MILGGIVALAVFTVVELRIAQPIFNVRLFARRKVAAVLIGPSIALGVALVVPALLSFLALYPAIPHVSAGFGWSVMHLAIVGIPAGAAWVLSGLGSSYLLRRYRPRPIWMVSSVVLTGSVVLAALYHHTTGEVIAVGVLISLATGAAMSTANAMIVSVVSAEEQAASNGIASMLNQLVGTVGLQLLFVVLAHHSTLFQGVAFYQDVAFRDGYLVMAGIIAVGVLLSLIMPHIQRPEDAEMLPTAVS